MATRKTLGGAEAFARFLPVAKKAAGRVVPLRADPRLARHNVSLGVEAVMRHELRIRRELPKVDVRALRALPDLAIAVIHAADEVERAGGGEHDELSDLLTRARELRELLLTSAESLVRAGVVADGELAKIRAGLGPLDSAKDCVALAALFRKHQAKAASRSPVEKATIDEAERIGNELAVRLKPIPGPRAPSGAAKVTASARDRLWTLLVQRHELLWRVGAYLYGRAVERQVPGLQAPPKRRTSRAPSR